MRRLALLAVLTAAASAQILTPDEVFEQMYKDKVPLSEAWSDAPSPDVEIGDLDPLFERFLELREVYRDLPNDDKGSVTEPIGEVMDEVIVIVKNLLPAGPIAWDFFAKYSREDMFIRPRWSGRNWRRNAEEGATRTLWQKLDELRDAYVDTAFHHAHGPNDLEALFEALVDRDLEEAAQKVQEILVNLEEVKEAGSRKRARKKAFEVRSEVAALLTALGAESAEELSDLVDWMEKKRWTTPEAELRMHEVVSALGLRERYSTELFTRISVIDPRDNRREDELADLQESYDGKLTKEASSIVRKLQNLADDCEKVGEYGTAAVLHEIVLVIDEDDKKSRAAMGFTQIGGNWLRPFAAAQAAKGLVWTDKGWAEQVRVARLEAGEVFDNGTWKPLADADKEHAAVATPWEIPTGHFVVRSTAGLEQSVVLCNRLEAFLELVQRQLDGLFSWERSHALGFEKPLQVFLYKDAAERTTVIGEASGAAVLDADNVLHVHMAGGALPFTALNHQQALQILHAVVDEPPVWLLEGAATYFEAAVFWENRMRLGSARRNPRIASYATALNGESAKVGFEQVSTLRRIERWNAGDVPAQEEAAAAAFAFLMVMDSGRFRADLLRMLEDSSLQPEEAVGLTRDSIALLLEHYYRGLVPSAPRAPRMPGQPSS